MAKLSSDGKYVTVEKGDTLWDIAKTFLDSGIKYKDLAAINELLNPDLIHVGQKIYLNDTGSSSTKTSTNCPTIHQFGLLSNSDNTLFATWKWSKSNTASYKVQWTYSTGDGVWFSGNNTSITVDEDDPAISRQSTYTVPNNAKRVRFKVKPISKTKQDSEGKETSYWTAKWSDVNKAIWNKNTVPPGTPPVPTVKIEGNKLTASLSNIDIDGATGIKFAIVKKSNDTKVYKYSKVITISSKDATFSCNVDVGDEYKVCCKAYNKSNNLYSDEWSAYSGYVGTIPATPRAITTIRGSSETSVYLEWSASTSAKTYIIQYTDNKSYFDTTNKPTSVSDVEFTKFEVTGLETGHEYFFRVRAKNSVGESGWSGIKSVVIGSKPVAPTTWSSTTTAIKGEDLTLYWIHNAEDGSDQTFAEIEMYIDEDKRSYTIKNEGDSEEGYVKEYEDEGLTVHIKNETGTCVVNTSSYTEGVKIEWRIRTAGVTKTYGDWSIKRTVEIYAPPTQDLRVMDVDKNDIDVVNTFPFRVYSLAGPESQTPIGYHLTITSTEVYETVDSVGNAKVVNVGDAVFSKYYDIKKALSVKLSAGDIDLENNVTYTVTSTVVMDSGLTNETSVDFTVSWNETSYEPNAEISIDKDTLTASIRPYCHLFEMVKYEVVLSGGEYIKTSNELERIWGNPVKKKRTTTGERVYSGVLSDGTTKYYCEVEKKTLVTDVLISVYRREFDGSFTELIKDVDGAKNTTIIDPHPALDFARYRIVATSKTTGSVDYYDLPGYPVNGTSVVIQWGEDWSSFETSEDEEPEQPPWSGSLLKLPYNIDVSDSHAPDVALIEYIGREHPVSYYGTQLGTTSTWNVEIEKSDEETLYALRRLARYMGDAYVREPSGSGYWANVVVSFNQTHCKPTVPVSLTITRVEGGA